jgi:transcriptional regulator with AAA-type ATPase domain
LTRNEHLVYIECMTAIIKLDKKDRDFFCNVHSVAFCNPFETKSLELYLKIAGDKKDSDYILREKVAAAVSEKLKKISTKGNLNWQFLAGEESEYLRMAILYDAYHKYFDEFEMLIVNQIAADNVPCSVPFAQDALSYLHQNGFSKKEALHYFAFFYQLARAWYFIYQGLIGRNPSIEKLRSDLWRNIFTYNSQWYEKLLWDRMEDFSTFLVGETGTGKGTAAKAIGRSGYIPFDQKKGCFAESFTRNFIEINLSQFPESLIESELFGHKKGSFTGAIGDHKGVFARCSRYGAIFLDEIGDISIPVQIKLLKVIQERNFSAVGSHEKLHFHGRVIAATNKSLEELRRHGKIRDDFYYRLCSDIILVPSLNQQIAEDHNSIKILVEHVVQKILGESAPEQLKHIMEILDNEIDYSYRWPGNVRELEQAIRRILLTNHYSGEIFRSPDSMIERVQMAIKEGSLNAQELLSWYCAVLYQQHGTYEKVGSITKLDRRTVKKYIMTVMQN